MKEIYCTVCEQVIGTLNGRDDIGESTLNLYRETTVCESNHTETEVIGTDEEGTEITRTVGSLNFRDM